MKAASKEEIPNGWTLQGTAPPPQQARGQLDQMGIMTAPQTPMSLSSSLHAASLPVLSCHPMPLLFLSHLGYRTSFFPSPPDVAVPCLHLPMPLPSILPSRAGVATPLVQPDVKLSWLLQGWCLWGTSNYKMTHQESRCHGGKPKHNT